MTVSCDECYNMQKDKVTLPKGIKKKFKEKGLLELNLVGQARVFLV